MTHHGICNDPECPLKRFEQQAKARAFKDMPPEERVVTVEATVAKFDQAIKAFAEQAQK